MNLDRNKFVTYHMNMDSYDCCTSDSSSPEIKQVSSLSALLKLVGDESRLKILCILQKGIHCVCEIEKHVNLSQTLVSHHLKDLKDAGIIESEKKNKWVYYSLTNEGKKITDAIFGLQDK